MGMDRSLSPPPSFTLWHPWFGWGWIGCSLARVWEVGGRMSFPPQIHPHSSRAGHRETQGRDRAPPTCIPSPPRSQCLVEGVGGHVLETSQAQNTRKRGRREPSGIPWVEARIQANELQTVVHGWRTHTHTHTHNATTTTIKYVGHERRGSGRKRNAQTTRENPDNETIQEGKTSNRQAKAHPANETRTSVKERIRKPSGWRHRSYPVRNERKKRRSKTSARAHARGNGGIEHRKPKPPSRQPPPSVVQPRKHCKPGIEKRQSHNPCPDQGKDTT